MSIGMLPARSAAAAAAAFSMQGEPSRDARKVPTEAHNMQRNSNTQAQYQRQLHVEHGTSQLVVNSMLHAYSGSRAFCDI